ncbi:MAG: hypothetical protein K2O00_07695 [Muribaculaceae bacterium]|nr:hypothetical protein [Muribaculaceae bacterium]
MSNKHYLEDRVEEERINERKRRSRVNKTSVWVAIGAVVLIILLIVWLTMADFFGDTDVAAMITPML